MSAHQQEEMLGKAKPAGTSVWLKGIGTLRDGLLVFGAATYGLGYLVWSIHAKQENLGLLPALEPQYLAAGVIPMLLVWLAYFGAKGAMWVPKAVAKWRDRQSGNWPRVWRGAGFACWIVGFGLTEWMDKLESAGPSHHYLVLVFSISIILLFFSGAILWFYPSTDRKPTSTWDRIGWAFQKGFVRLFMFLYLAAFLAAFAFSYILVLYPAIPQEFGGVRPRCAYIDVAKDQVSEAIRKEILPGSAAESKNPVVQSLRMNVYFSGSDFMLIKPYPGASQADQSKAKLFELRKDVVKAVNWCD